jgi:hypothetical protein
MEKSDLRPNQTKQYRYLVLVSKRGLDDENEDYDENNDGSDKVEFLLLYSDDLKLLNNAYARSFSTTTNPVKMNIDMRDQGMNINYYFKRNVQKFMSLPFQDKMSVYLQEFPGIQMPV